MVLPLSSFVFSSCGSHCSCSDTLHEGISLYLACICLVWCAPCVISLFFFLYICDITKHIDLVAQSTLFKSFNCLKFDIISAASGSQTGMRRTAMRHQGAALRLYSSIIQMQQECWKKPMSVLIRHFFLNIYKHWLLSKELSYIMQPMLLLWVKIGAQSHFFFLILFRLVRIKHVVYLYWNKKYMF